MSRRDDDTSTEPESLDFHEVHGPLPLALTVIFHPTLERIGERAFLGNLKPGEERRLGRREPRFAQPRRGVLRALEHRRLSRRGLILRGIEGEAGTDELELDASEWANSLHVDGQVVDGRHRLTAVDLDRGVALLLARRIVLWLHRHEPITDLTDGLGLVGESSGLVKVRNEISVVAKGQAPVLLRGETGVGKELVAQAIARHPNNPRRDRPLVVRNMAAIPADLAVPELFGAVKGAFTGQVGRRQGAFRRADGGTLFLDEIGETAFEVQPMLLRVLENGELVPLGQGEAVKVDVRILAATDLDLEDAVAGKRFRSPLLHRLSGYEIRVPPLRERLDDLGRLLVHFLRAAMEERGEGRRLEVHAENFPWLPATWVAELLAYSWPGNVRQLGKVVLRWTAGLDEEQWRPDFARLARRVQERAMPRSAVLRPEPAPTPAKVSDDAAAPVPLERSETVGASTGHGRRSRRRPAEITHDDLRSALEASDFIVADAATALGIGRTSIYKLMERHGLRTSKDLGGEEIQKTLAEQGGDIDATARALQVSKPGLITRMGKHGLL